jgi:hypothetical protein
MYQRWRDASEVYGGGGINTLEVVRAVGTCQHLSGQDGTCLELLLLHAGPNSDGFGGQAFMEHYNKTSLVSGFAHYHHPTMPACC